MLYIIYCILTTKQARGKKMFLQIVADFQNIFQYIFEKIPCKSGRVLQTALFRSQL